MTSFDDHSDDGLATLSKALAAAEAEFHATLDESIQDIERVTLNADQRAGNKSTSLEHDEYSYGSFDGDDFSLDNEVDNLEGIAMEDLANELCALDNNMDWNQPVDQIPVQNANTGSTVNTVDRAAPFEGKGRRARARRARIKREIEAREERARNKSATKLPISLSSSSLAKAAAASSGKEPLKSVPTSSLGRALAASKTKGAEETSKFTRTGSNASNGSSSKFDNKRNGKRTGGRGMSKSNSYNGKQEDYKYEQTSTTSKARPAVSKPYEGKGRRARARRARERHEAQQAQTIISGETNDFPNFSLCKAVVGSNE